MIERLEDRIENLMTETAPRKKKIPQAPEVKKFIDEIDAALLRAENQITKGAMVFVLASRIRVLSGIMETHFNFRIDDALEESDL
jgi:hypothetical protein